MNLEFSHFPSWRAILHSISEANELKLFIMFLVAVIMPDSWDVTRMELEGAAKKGGNNSKSLKDESYFLEKYAYLQCFYIVSRVGVPIL